MARTRAVRWLVVLVALLGVGVVFGLGARSDRSRLHSGAPSAGAAATRPERLPFIADDYDRAVAQARERKLPIFIESWAPW